MNYLLVGLNAKYIHTNLAIRYLYTSTKEHFDVDFMEFTIKDQDESILQKITEEDHSLIGFSCYIWNIEKILRIVSALKKQNPGIKILLGGPEVSYDTDYFLSEYPVDYIISGEGEYPFIKLLEAIEFGLDFKNIPQLHYKLYHEIVHNNMEYFIDFNSLPSPYRLERDLPQLRNRIQYIESSRGCPYRCSYCLASLEKHVRHFDSERIKDEIRYLMRHGAKVFKFLDRTFNIRKDYALDLFSFIIAEHLPDTVFQFEISGDLLDENIINYLNLHAPRGLIRFEIGVQSTNPLTNKLILRTQNYQRLVRNVQLIQEGEKIDLHLDLIAGLPREDYPSFIKTFNDVFFLRPYELQLGFLKMLRGTKIRDESDLYHYQYDSHAPYEIISHQAISKEELFLIHKAEFILDKYYNLHRMDTALNYILDYLYIENSYAFFESYGDYWYNHFDTIGYQHYELYMRLDQFISMRHPDSYASVHDLILFDYIKDQKVRAKIWFDQQLNKEDKLSFYRDLIKNSFPLDFDLLSRYGLVVKLSLHPITLKQETTYLLKLYHPHNQTYYLIPSNKKCAQ